MTAKSGSLSIAVHNWDRENFPLYRVAGCPIFRGCLSIEVNGRAVGTFRIVRYILGVHYSGVSVKWGSTLLICCLTFQTQCSEMAPGLSNNVSCYAVSVNKQTVEQKYVCVSDSEQCSYAWNDADHNAVNYTVSVAANNMVGQGVTKNCTTTPISEHKT